MCHFSLLASLITVKAQQTIKFKTLCHMLRLTISAFCLLCTVAIVAASPAVFFGAPLREVFQPPSILR